MSVIHTPKNMTISKKWPVQFLKQTLEERLFAAYMLRVKTHSVLAVGESCCRAVQKQGGLNMSDALLRVTLWVTAVPVPKGVGDSWTLYSSFTAFIIHRSSCRVPLSLQPWSSGVAELWSSEYMECYIGYSNL